MAICVRMGIAMLVFTLGMYGGAALADGCGQTRCRWQELVASASEDACILDALPFTNTPFGILDRL